MKKLFTILSLAVGLTLSSQAQIINWPDSTIIQAPPVTWPVPLAGLCTNLINGAGTLYQIEFYAPDATTATTNMAFSIYDSPLSNSKGGGVHLNSIAYTNTGYTTYVAYTSNMNWGAAGSVNIAGVNAFTNYGGAITYITNSSVLSNYLVTTPVVTAGGNVLRPKLFSGVALTNTTTTFTFPSGIRFGMGLTLTNTQVGGTAAMLTPMTVTLYYRPYR
jgi:hypothetical protein